MSDTKTLVERLKVFAAGTLSYDEKDLVCEAADALEKAEAALCVTYGQLLSARERAEQAERQRDEYKAEIERLRETKDR